MVFTEGWPLFQRTIYQNIPLLGPHWAIKFGEPQENNNNSQPEEEEEDE